MHTLKFRAGDTRKTNSFKVWAIKQEIGCGPEKDFVDDLKHDYKNFPRASNKDEILNYLHKCGACGGAIEAFENLFNEYTKNGD